MRGQMERDGQEGGWTVSMKDWTLYLAVKTGLCDIARKQKSAFKVSLKAWSDLCREVFPDYDLMDKCNRAACRKRIKLSVIVLWRERFIRRWDTVIGTYRGNRISRPRNVFYLSE